MSDLASELAALRKRVVDLEGLELGRGVRARVYNSADIVLATAANTALTFNSERYDSDTLHSTSSNTSRLTVPYDGYYLIGGSVRFAANATGSRSISLVVSNTSSIAGQNTDNLGAATTVQLTVVAAYQLVAGDYVELFASQNSGGNLNVLAVGNLSPEFWIERLLS
jgi:hypothetical protein